MYNVNNNADNPYAFLETTEVCEILEVPRFSIVLYINWKVILRFKKLRNDTQANKQILLTRPLQISNQKNMYFLLDLFSKSVNQELDILLHRRMHVCTDRQLLRERTGFFTEEDIGRRFRSYFDTHLALLKWGHKYVAARDGNLTMLGSDNQPYHYILPSLYRLFHFLTATNR